MKLLAEVKDEDLLFKLMHVLGATFYRLLGDDLVEVVYFSGEKIAHFRGKLTDEHRKLLEAQAWKVEDISVDELEDKVTIKQ